MKPTAINPLPSFPVTEQSPQSTGVTTNVTPPLNTKLASQFTRYEKSSTPHINCPESPLTNALLCIKKPDGMEGNDEPGFAGVFMFTNTEFLKLLFEIFQPHPSYTESYETIQTNDVHQPLKLINITAPASPEATSITEAIYLCNLHLLTSSLTDTKLQDVIAHYDLNKCHSDNDYHRLFKLSRQ